MVRSPIKFLPWEIAHTAIWHVPGQPITSMAAPINFLGYAVALTGAAAFAGAVFRGRGRTPYDLVAGTMVVEAPPTRRIAKPVRGRGATAERPALVKTLVR